MRRLRRADAIAELLRRRKEDKDKARRGMEEEQLVEGERNAASIELPEGCTRERVEWIMRRLDRNEYKRRQPPLVLRTSPKAFGTGRRLPIVHRFE